MTTSQAQIDICTIDVSIKGIDLKDLEFIAAVRAALKSKSPAAQVLYCSPVLANLET